MAFLSWIMWVTFVVAWTLAITSTSPVSTWIAVAATAAIIGTRQIRLTGRRF